MNPGFDPTLVSDWLRDAKTAVELLNAGKKLLPKGKHQDDLGAKIDEARHSLERSDASLAQGLGYRLCQCKFPPSIMLWREKEKSYLCQNDECGRRIDMSASAVPSSALGPNSWMA